MKKYKHGISLIVLVITIIVMIILASVMIISLSNSGVINKANEAVDASNLSQMENIASLAWMDAYLDGKRGNDLILIVENKLLAEDKEYKQKYSVIISDAGVSVTAKDEEWITIYDVGENTENGMLTIADGNIFNTKDKFRLAIEGPQYTGSIETNKILELYNFLIFAIIDNNNAFIPKSLADIEANADKFTEDAILIVRNEYGR